MSPKVLIIFEFSRQNSNILLFWNVFLAQKFDLLIWQVNQNWIYEHKLNVLPQCELQYYQVLI